VLEPCTNTLPLTQQISLFRMFCYTLQLQTTIFGQSIKLRALQHILCNNVKLHVTELAVKYHKLPADGCLQIKNLTGISNIKRCITVPSKHVYAYLHCSQ